MKTTVLRNLLAALVLAVLMAGCGSSSTSANQTNFQALLMTADLSSNSLAQGISSLDPLGRPQTDLSQMAKVVVNLKCIELVGEGGRVAELEPNTELGDSDGDGNPDIDLMALSGKATTIVKGTVPAGVYTQFRLF